MKKYRVAIVGLGRMGSIIDEQLSPNDRPFSIAASCRASTRLELVAGADTLQERREAFREKWGINALYEDYQEMVEQEQPDLVAVCTTATGLAKPARRSPSIDFKEDSHADLAVQVANTGTPMLYVEKAMACSMNKADEVLEACRKHGTKFNTGVIRRFDNRYQVLREAIERGEIGEPKVAVHYGPTNLMHGHIHSIDTISYLLGDPTITAVRGELKPRDLKIENNRLEEDPFATYQIAFGNGVEALTVPAGQWELEVIGTEGSIRSTNNGERVALQKVRQAADLNKQWEEAPVPKVERKSATVACLEDLVDAYESGEPSLGNAEVTHHITESCLAVAVSHEQGGRWVQLPIENRDLYIFHV